MEPLDLAATEFEDADDFDDDDPAPPTRFTLAMRAAAAADEDLADHDDEEAEAGQLPFIEPGSRKAAPRLAEDTAHDAPATDARDEWAISSRPVAVAGGDSGDFEDVPLATPSPSLGRSDPSPPSSDVEAPEVENPREELFVGIACLLLAASVFLPWYSMASFPAKKSLSGWASGNFGPVIFFLALAGLVTVIFRRFKVPIGFPIEHSLVLEGIGWLSVVMLLLKRIFIHPTGVFNTKLLSDNKSIAALVAAVLVALLAGRISSNAPLIIRPGWFAGRAGKTGIGVLALALIVGTAFGLTNPPAASTKSPGGGFTQPRSEVKPGLPRCAKRLNFVLVDGVNKVQGVDGNPCTVLGQTSLKLSSLVSREKSALEGRGWTLIDLTPKITASLSRIYKITRQKQCGTLTMFDNVRAKQRSITAFFSDSCLAGSPGPRRSN